MGILPEILIKKEVEDKKDNELNNKKTYIIDFINKKMFYKNGRPVTDDIIKATKMYIQKLILTELGKWEYHNNYGTIFKELTLNKKYSNLAHRVLIEENLKKQLLKYHNIVAVNDIKIKQNYKTLYISFNVVLKNKEILQWEEVIK